MAGRSMHTLFDPSFVHRPQILQGRIRAFGKRRGGAAAVWCITTASEASHRLLPFGHSCGNLWSSSSSFLKTRVDNCEQAHNICLRGSSATNRLTVALASCGNELERSEPQQNFRA